MKKNGMRFAQILLLMVVLMACQSNGTDISGSMPGRPVGEGGTERETDLAPIQRDPATGGNFLIDFPNDQILSGGVSKDGIPALTDPEFVALTSPEAAYLRDDDLVMGVIINGEAKAYPHNMGWWHEIVNDVVGGHPVVVSFCPLTGTGLVFDGGTGAERLTCGVSGLLFNNNLIMYDRRDDRTLYPQMIHTPIPGSGGHSELNLMPVIETTWRFWKALYPHSKVISVNAGTYSSGRYNEYPYGSYREPATPPTFPATPALSDNSTAQMFPPKTITLGVRFGEIAKAYPFPIMGDHAVINDQVAGQNIVVVFYEKEHYAVPFSRLVDGEALTFEKIPLPVGDVFPFVMQDLETGSTWNLKGEAIAGPYMGRHLRPVPAHNAFWFAWSTFWQNTGIY